MPKINSKTVNAEMVLRAAREYARMAKFGTELQDGMVHLHSPDDAQRLKQIYADRLMSEAILYYQRVGDTEDLPDDGVERGGGE